MSLQGRERKGQVPEIGKPPCSKRAFDPQMVEVVCGRRPLSLSVVRAIDAPRARVCHLASRRPVRRVDGVEESQSPSRPREYAAALASTPPPRHTSSARRSASSSYQAGREARPARSASR